MCCAHHWKCKIQNTEGKIFVCKQSFKMIIKILNKFAYVYIMCNHRHTTAIEWGVTRGSYFQYRLESEHCKYNTTMFSKHCLIVKIKQKQKYSKQQLRDLSTTMRQASSIVWNLEIDSLLIQTPNIRTHILCIIFANKFKWSSKTNKNAC